LFTENDYFDNSEDEGNYDSDEPFLDDDRAWKLRVDCVKTIRRRAWLIQYGRRKILNSWTEAVKYIERL